MNNIIKILIIAVASTWAFPMSGAKAEENTSSPAELTKNYADTTKTTVSAPVDTISQKQEVQARDAATVENVGAEDNPMAEPQKKETSSALWYLTLLWLIVLTACMAYIFYRFGKRIENHSKALHKFKDDQARATASGNTNLTSVIARVSELENTIASLRSENDRLRSRVSQLNGTVQALSSGTQIITNSGNTRRTVTPTSGESAGSKNDVFYVDTLNIGGDGTLTIPLQILKEKNSGELFMVTGNIQEGTATYTINPKAANLMGQVSKLQKFCDGLTVVRGSHITVESPGTLSRDGYDLRVVHKLIVKSE